MEPRKQIVIPFGKIHAKHCILGLNEETGRFTLLDGHSCVPDMKSSYAFLEPTWLTPISPRQETCSRGCLVSYVTLPPNPGVCGPCCRYADHKLSWWSTSSDRFSLFISRDSIVSWSVRWEQHASRDTLFLAVVYACVVQLTMFWWKHILE